jgi:hypothetical protein
MDAVITVLGIVVSAMASCAVAIINSNAQRAKTEQKVEDTFLVIKDTLSSVNTRLDNLEETDSCCTILKDDVAQIKEEITIMAASINQLKAESQQADTLQMKTNMLMLRHAINEGYRVFKDLGVIDKKSKDSLLALGDIYIKEYRGNSFVEDELNLLRELPMI